MTINIKNEIMKTKMIFSVSIMILTIAIVTLSCDEDVQADLLETTPSSRIDTFTFSHNGEAINGKVFLPAAYENNNNLPAIYLIDYTEQHWVVALDEFEKLVDGVEQIQGFDALVVTLEKHLDIDAQPQEFNKYYGTFKRSSMGTRFTRIQKSENICFRWNNGRENSSS